MATKFEYNEEAHNSNWGLYTPGNVWGAQTFSNAAIYSISSVDLLMHRSGSGGNVTVSIRAVDGSNHPTGVDLAVSNPVDCTAITTNGSGEWVTFTFISPYVTTGGTTYAIVARGDTVLTDTVRWEVDTSSPSYANGNFVTSGDSGSSWTTRSWDGIFRVWGTASGGVELDIADSLTIVEAVTFYWSISGVDISDPIAITESLTISMSADYNPDISDSITITEALTIVLDIPRGVLWRDRPIILTINVADAISITESLGPAGLIDKSISDSITITEAITIALTVLFVDVVDSIIVTESLTPSKGLTSGGYSDSITITEKLTIAFVVGPGKNPLPVQRQQVR